MNLEPCSGYTSVLTPEILSFNPRNPEITAWLTLLSIPTNFLKRKKKLQTGISNPIPKVSVEMEWTDFFMGVYTYVEVKTRGSLSHN